MMSVEKSENFVKKCEKKKSKFLRCDTKNGKVEN